MLLKNQRSTTTVPRNKDVHQYTAINMSCVNHGTDRWGTCVCRYQFQRRPRCQRDRSLCVPDPRRSACRATHQQTLSSVAQDGVTADARSCCHSKPMGLLAPITTSWDYLHLQVHHGDYLHLQAHLGITCTYRHTMGITCTYRHTMGITCTYRHTMGITCTYRHTMALPAPTGTP